MNYHTRFSNEKVLTRDILHRKLTGVCAGLSQHYGLPRLAVRIVTVLCFISFPKIVAVAYLVASILMPKGK